MQKDINVKKITFSSILIIILLLGVFSFYAERLELIAYDLRTILRHKQASGDIIIVNVDDEALKEASTLTKEGLGRFPWPRTVWSQAIQFINKGKPKAVLVDLMCESEAREELDPRFSDKKFIEDLQKIPNLFFPQYIDINGVQLEALTNKLIKEGVQFQGVNLKNIKNFDKEKNDLKHQLINNLLKGGPNELIKKFTYKVKDNTLNNIVFQKKLNYYSLPFYLSGIYKVAQGVGINNVVSNPLDKTVRDLQPIYKYNDRYILTVSLALANFIKGNKEEFVLLPNELKFGKTNIKLSKDITFYLNWRSKALINKFDKDNSVDVPARMTYKSVCFMRVFHGEKLKLSPDIFKDKIVIIGIGSSKNVTDIHKVPNNTKFLGMEILATAIDNFLNDKSFVQRAAPWVNILVCIIMAVVIVFVFYRYLKFKSYYKGIKISFIVLAVYILANLLLFSEFAYWLDIVYPVVVAIITLGFCVSISLIVERAKRSQVENTFSKFVSPQVYKVLLADYKNVDLSATKRDVTLLFSDIRGFTPLVESLSPEEVARYVNEFFIAMTDIILNNNGTIDKFMGDAIMAFFGAPLPDKDHAFMAAKTAIEMINELKKLNKYWMERGRRPLNIGIGLNTGPALIGNFGSKKMMNYTAMGDSVNLASRLESLNKDENTNVLISAFTYQQIKDRVDVRILGPRNLKGKAERIVVYELLGIKE